MYIVEGLHGDQIAVVTKIHHCTIDGVSGAELLSQLFDLEPEPATSPRTRRPAARWTNASRRSSSSWRRSLGTRLKRPVGITRLAWRTGRALLDVKRVRARGLRTRRVAAHHPPYVAQRGHHPAPAGGVLVHRVGRRQAREDGPVTPPSTTWSSPCAPGALRRYLLDGEELPDGPLVATVPVSTAPTVANRRGANKVSAMFVALPCQVEDPVERLRAIREGTKGAKEEHNALGADVLLNWAEHATPNVFSTAARAYTRPEAGRPPPAHPQPGDLQRARARLPAVSRRAPSSWPASPWARSWTGRD